MRNVWRMNWLGIVILPAEIGAGQYVISAAVEDRCGLCPRFRRDTLPKRPAAQTRSFSGDPPVIC
ncbi:MAG: hypothetical protein JXB07_14130 [Anaerolineae bacterium]|nr:hypothetical protein [Anaerolineae bacterium]